jgi:hypothetical protein
MNTDETSFTIAQLGLRQIESAVLRLLSSNPQGLRNVEIANGLGLKSEFEGRDRNYLTFSVLGILLDKHEVFRDLDRKVYLRSQDSSLRENELSPTPQLWGDNGLAEAGRAVYERIIAELDDSSRGKIVIIDIESGDYEIGDSDLEATLRLLERRPTAITWGERVGSPAPYVMRERVSFG